MSDISKIKVGETTYDIKDQAGRDAFTNSKTTTVDSTSDDDHIPTAKAAYDYGQVVKNDVMGAMVTTISSASDDAHYPSARAVYNYVQANAGSGSGSGENSGSTDSGGSVASGFNLADYYAVNTIHVIPEMIPEDADEFQGMRRVSGYTNKDVLFHVQAMTESQIYTATDYLVNFAAADYPFPAYVLANELGIMLLPEDVTFQQEVQDPETGTTTTEEISLSAGIYCPPTFQMIISCLEKKEKYLVQETISFNKNATPVLGQFFKSSDNIDIEGLYSALTLTDLTTQGESLSLSFRYVSGGYFKPIAYFMPELALPTIYALEGSFQPGGLSSIIVTEETTIPEEYSGTAFTVEPGTYLALVEDVPCLELVKLQEKELPLDLDSILGQDENGQTLLEALLLGLDASETGEVNLTFSGSSQNLEKNIKKIQNIFRTAFDKNGQVIFRQSGEQGFVTFKMRPHLIEFGDMLSATASGYIHNAGMWLDAAIQVTVSDSGISVFARAKQSQMG